MPFCFKIVYILRADGRFIVAQTKFACESITSKPKFLSLSVSQLRWLRIFAIVSLKYFLSLIASIASAMEIASQL